MKISTLTVNGGTFINLDDGSRLGSYKSYSGGKDIEGDLRHHLNECLKKINQIEKRANFLELALWQAMAEREAS